LSIDTQTRGLNDLGEKFLKIVERAAEDTSMQGVMDNEVKYSREGAYFYLYIVDMFPCSPIPKLLTRSSNSVTKLTDRKIRWIIRENERDSQYQRHCTKLSIAFFINI
jgi:hypothetical protein